MRFFVSYGEGLETKRAGYDTIDEANDVAAGLRKRGYARVIVAAGDEPEIDQQETIADMLEQPRCRQIRWAGVAP